MSYIFCKDSTIQMLYSELDMTSGMLHYQMFCKMHQTEHRSHRHRSVLQHIRFHWKKKTSDLVCGGYSEHFLSLMLRLVQSMLLNQVSKLHLWGREGIAGRVR